MIKKGHKLYSILYFKCPQCHEGDFFKSTAYNLKKIGELHDKCQECNHRYSKEPGFYFGAMYVSYAFGIAIFVSIYLANIILNINASILNVFLMVALFILLGTPYLFHLSKITWANIFTHFKGRKL